MFDGCGSIGAGIVALFASAALGWRFEAALGVVVVEERGRRVIELACLVGGEAGGVTVERVRENGHTLVLAGGSRARRLGGGGVFRGGHRRVLALGLFGLDCGRLFCGWPRASGVIAARVFRVSAGGPDKAKGYVSDLSHAMTAAFRIADGAVAWRSASQGGTGAYVNYQGAGTWTFSTEGVTRYYTCTLSVHQDP
jgi:hypothetical protein